MTENSAKPIEQKDSDIPQVQQSQLNTLHKQTELAEFCRALREPGGYRDLLLQTLKGRYRKNCNRWKVWDTYSNRYNDACMEEICQVFIDAMYQRASKFRNEINDPVEIFDLLFLTTRLNTISLKNEIAVTVNSIPELSVSTTDMDTNSELIYVGYQNVVDLKLGIYRPMQAQDKLERSILSSRPEQLPANSEENMMEYLNALFPNKKDKEKAMHTLETLLGGRASGELMIIHGEEHRETLRVLLTMGDAMDNFGKTTNMYGETTSYVDPLARILCINLAGQSSQIAQLLTLKKTLPEYVTSYYDGSPQRRKVIGKLVIFCSTQDLPDQIPVHVPTIHLSSKVTSTQLYSILGISNSSDLHHYHNRYIHASLIYTLIRRRVNNLPTTSQLSVYGTSYIANSEPIILNQRY